MKENNVKVSIPKKTIGIVVNGGPAPGINGVISAATIEAINDGYKVLGIYDGFKWLEQGILDNVKSLEISDVSRIHSSGGSILRTSRLSFAHDPNRIKSVVHSLKKLNITHLIVIGGDGSAYVATKIYHHSSGDINVVHVPKTIDNDLPLPEGVSTFGFQTARHVGTQLIKNIMEDAATCNRWYFIIAMGRHAGHLALGIAKAAGATLAIIPEEFPNGTNLTTISRILEGAILKRRAMGRYHGVAILAEGLSDLLDTSDLGDLSSAERDVHGNVKYSDIPLGRLVQKNVQLELLKRNINVSIVDKRIGYELRSAPPVPFDVAYTRDLGYGAIKCVTMGISGVMVTIQGGRLVPIPFEQMIDPTSKKINVRFVDVHTEAYEVAKKYMIQLNKSDFDNSDILRKLAEVSNLTKKEFLERFDL